MIRVVPLPKAPRPHAIGVDDWALRKGRTYGTIVVDLERRRPLDLLPNRSAATLAAWMRREPQIRLVTRDRSTEYARGSLPTPSPLSVDLRARVVAAVTGGASCHGAARFGVSVSSASRWAQRFHTEGKLAPKPLGGDRPSHRIEAHACLILALHEERSEIFLHELRDALAERGVTTSTSGLSRFFARHRITRKRGRFTRPSRCDRT